MFSEPLKVAALMRAFEPDWFVAGGWAIDLFLGRETRPHDDIEIAVFRRDQLALQKHLDDWILKKAVSGELTDWSAGEFLQLPVHEIHCFNERAATPFLEVLLNETDAENWIFRRDARITRPLSKLSATAADSDIKFLRPEIILLYKSKNPRAKDERDFQTTLPRLTSGSRRWLKEAISVCYEEHYWLPNL